MDLVKEIYKLSEKHPNVRGLTRKDHHKWNRYLLWLWLYDNFQLSLPVVGRLTQFDRPEKFDHATVLNGIRAARWFFKTKDKEFYVVTKELGMELFPEVYSDWLNVTQFKNYDEKIEDVIIKKLDVMGADTSTKFEIVGKLGDQVLTLDGFITIVKHINQKL